MSMSSASSVARNRRKGSLARQKLLVEATIESLERRALLSAASFAPAVNLQLIGHPTSVITDQFVDSDFSDVVTANDNGTITYLVANAPTNFLRPQILLDGVGDGPAVVMATPIGGDQLSLLVANPSTDKIAALINDGNGTFGPPIVTAMSGSFLTAVTADVNDDGLPDLIVSRNNGTISVLLGNGDGTFQKAIRTSTEFVAGGGPIAVADFNGDESQDLAVVNSQYNTVSILLGNGSGAFTVSPTTYEVGDGASAIATAQLTGSGNQDLVVANNLDMSVTVLLGNGDGSFQSGRTTLTAICHPTSIAIADMNHDGRPDLILTSDSATGVDVILNNGNGQFGDNRIFADPGTDHTLAVTDLNGDGHPDVITADYSTRTVSVLLNICGSNLFGTQSTLTASNGPVAVATGLFTNNGRQDLAVISNSDNQLQIFLGNGDGTFSTGGSYYSVCRPSAIMVGDVNHDGIPDIVVASNYDGVVAVFLGNGDGTFQSPIDTIGLNISPGVNSIALGDFNGDGDADLAIANGYSGTLQVLFSQGNGSFAFNASYQVGSNDAFAVASADLNHDGHPDLVAVDSNANEAYVLMNNGDGTFATPEEYDTGSRPVAIAIGDVTGSGNNSIVIVDQINQFTSSPGEVTILPGNGDGTFGNSVTVSVGNQPYAVALGDVNGDNNLDIITSNSGNPTVAGSTVSVILSNGDGTFQNAQTVAVGNHPRGIATADLTGDGQADLVVANANDNNVGLLIATPADDLLGSPYSFNFTQRPSDVASGDFNNDGIPDLAVFDGRSDEMFVLLGNGDGTFATKGIYSVGSNYVSTIVTPDVVGDGNIDLVAALPDSGNLLIYLGNGDGTFQAPITLNDQYGVSYSSHAVAFADFNGDERDDLVVASGNNYASLFLSNGDGTFSAHRYSLQIAANIDGCSSYSPAITYAVATGDLNGDGSPDLVVTDTRNDVVDVLISNQSDGFLGLSSPVTYYVGYDPSSVAIGDVNKDNQADIVTSNSRSGTVSVLINDGGGTFISAQNFAAGTQPNSVLLGDFNGDGNVDIAVSNGTELPSSLPEDGITPDIIPNGDGGFSILAGNGKGSFALPLFTSSGNAPYVIVDTDLNGDGKPDIVVPDYLSGSLNLFLNNTAAPATPPSTIAVGNGPLAVVTGDLNGDGIPDMVVANLNDNTIEVFLGYGDGSFQAPRTYTVANGPSSIAIADINGDGKADIVVLSGSSHTLTTFLGNGDGTFAAGIATNVGHNVDDGPSALAVGQFSNADSHMDVAIAGGAYGTLTILYGNGDGHFQAANDTPIFSVNECLAYVSSIAAVDLNGDGHPDIVLTDSTYDTVDVLLSNNDGTFAGPARYSVGSTPSDVIAAPLVNQGNLDLIVTNAGDNTVSVLLGNGNGTFQSAQSYAVGSDPSAVVVGDFNNDGNVDIAVSDPGTMLHPGNTVAVLTGYGDGGFAPAKFLLVGNAPVSLAEADFKGNGGSDIVTANFLDNTLSVLLTTRKSLVGSITSSNGMVTVQTTPLDDTASITVSDGNVIITIDGQTNSFPISSTGEVVINLEAGNDSLVIGPGVPPVNVSGGEGNDTLIDNSSANNTMMGATGSDSIDAGTGTDSVLGGAGNDTLMGGGDGSFVGGNVGDDMIVGGSPSSTLRGGQGNDTVSTSDGGDYIRGGGGDNFFIDYGVSSPDTIVGGSGLNFAQNNPNDSMTEIYEVFDPTVPPSAIPAAVAAAIASATARANIAPAIPSPVSVQVTSGGTLVISGGVESDNISVTSDGTNIDITANSVVMTPVPIAELVSIRVAGMGGSDTLNVDSSVTLPATIVGGGGNDSLSGGSGDNVLIGGVGSDTLVGGSGENLLVPGQRNAFANAPTGNDVLNGGTGYSIADFSHRTDDLHLSNDGNPDSGDVNSGETTTIDSNVSAIWGGTSADTIVGTTASMFLSGGGGADSITGGAANGVIVGGLGRDTVIVNAEPVALYLRDGKHDEYAGANNPIEDILQLDDGLDTTLNL